MNSHSKNAAQATTISLFSMRGKSWSCYQKHVSNLIEFDHDMTLSQARATADVQRLDLLDCNLYGESPSDPGPMVLCNQCNHIMAPEGIMRHVKRIHGSKIVPAPSNKLRIPSKGSSTAGAITSQNIGRLCSSNSTTPQATDASLSSEFSNRLNVSKMAPPTPLNSTEIANAVNSSSSNSNSPISLSKISTSTSGSGSGSNSRRSRKVLPVKDREYDPEKHCGVRIGNTKPCTRSLTCKTHQISLRRNVEGRSKPFDQLLADHRNNAKDTHKPNNKQTNYPAGDNGNQLLESIGDSNSSSSFDMERRSFSSNSNQSTIGNYNSDHSTAFSTSSQQLNGTHSLPSVLSSISATVSGGTTTPNFTYSDVNTHRKISNLIPFTPSPDDRSNNASQISDLYSANTMSAMQSTTTNAQANNHHLSNTASALNTSAALSSLGDYSMQMNDLINDDNGDGLDMSFWENFDNFNYEADLVMANNNSQHHQQSKLGSKRSHDSSGSDRKRKKGDELKDSSNHLKSLAKDGGTKVIPASALSNDSGQFTMKSNSNATTPQKKSIHLAANTSILPHNILIDSTPSEVICIDDDEDDATNNNIDATVNRNSDKENGTIYPVTPTKELGSDISVKHHASRSYRIDSSTTLNGTQSPPAAEKPLASMTLSSDPIVNSTDLVNVTKILSEHDHRISPATIVPPVITNAQNQHVNQMNDVNESIDKNQSNPNLMSVPIGENENFLLDMVYKCLRGKGVRLINSNYANSNNTNRSSSSDSNHRIREKENSIENHWSDDEIPTVPVSAANSTILPSGQRFSSSKCAYVPRAIAANHFNMARGRGIPHVKHSVDSTKKIQQQIFHRIQTQQHNGTFANANMIALRNNGSIMRFNSANLIGCSNIGSITNAINTGANSINAVKTTVANVVATTSPITNATTMANATNSNSTANAANASASAAAAVAVAAPPTTTNASVTLNTTPNATAVSNAATKVTTFKKPVHFVNTIATTTNGPIVLLNPTGNAGTVTSASGNPRYAIFRRPVNQSIQLIARPTIDPTNSYSVMPVIHRVRTRTLKPNLPKLLETDRLYESLKSIIRPQKSRRSFDTSQKVFSVYQSLVKAANQPNSHLNTSTNSSSSSSSSSKRKSHSSLSNHKNSNSHSSSQPTNNTTASQKQNGHSHGSSNGGIITSATNYIGSHASANSTSNHIDKRTHLRIANDSMHK